MRPHPKNVIPTPGFDQPVFDSQAVFRGVLDAMAHPGRILPLPSRLEAVGALGPAAVAIALALVDNDTPVWLDPTARSEAVADHLRFHCGCPFAGRPEDATFAFVAAPEDSVPLWSFGLGTPEYPDRSTTVILQVAQLANDIRGARLTGPGIESEARLFAAPLADGFWDQAKANHSFFPLGVDILFACGDRVAALPRSTAIEA